jgi:fatty acid desaturase
LIAEERTNNPETVSILPYLIILMTLMTLITLTILISLITPITHTVFAFSAPRREFNWTWLTAEERTRAQQDYNLVDSIVDRMDQV